LNMYMSIWLYGGEERKRKGGKKEEGEGEVE
jgi:hypothetical protein